MQSVRSRTISHISQPEKCTTEAGLVVRNALENTSKSHPVTEPKRTMNKIAVSGFPWDTLGRKIHVNVAMWGSFGELLKFGEVQKLPKTLNTRICWWSGVTWSEQKVGFGGDSKKQEFWN